MARVRKLDDSQKRYIVQRLACFATPDEVATAVNSEFGISITRQAVECYDPEKAAGKRLAKALAELFHETRKLYRERYDRIPIANKVVRLARLEKQYQAADQRGNIVLAVDIVERADKVVSGGRIRLEHTGKDGGPMQHDVSTMTPEQKRAELLALLSVPAAVPVKPE